MQIFLGLGKNLNNPAQEILIFPYNLSPKSNLNAIFSAPYYKANYLEVRYLIQVTQSLIFKNLEINRFCAKLRVQKRFRI